MCQALGSFIYIILMNLTLQGSHHYPHFTDGKTETQRGQGTCPRLQPESPCLCDLKHQVPRPLPAAPPSWMVPPDPPLTQAEKGAAGHITHPCSPPQMGTTVPSSVPLQPSSPVPSQEKVFRPWELYIQCPVNLHIIH